MEKLLILGSPYHQKLLMVQLNISLAQIPLKNFSRQSLRILANVLTGYRLHLAQTAINVGKIVKCIHCLKPYTVYTKKKFSDAHKRSMKYILSNFQYVWGTVFHDLLTDDKSKDSYVLEMLHCRENLTYKSPMEIPYYSSKLFKNICFYCGQERNLMPSNIEFYPQSTTCQSKTRAKVAKWKQVVTSDVIKKK